MARSWATLALVASVCFSPELFAETLYKHVAKDGTVTYSDAIPPDQGGKASRLRVDPTGNTVMPFRAPAESEGNARAPSQGQGRDAPAAPGTTLHHMQRTQDARVRVGAARKAFEDLRDNPTDSDFTWVSRPNYGDRGMMIGSLRFRVPTDDYVARLEGRVRDLREAEEQLKALERSVEF
jgi:hypothetical protein